MRKKALLAALALSGSAMTGTAMAQLGLSISIGQPGFYGQLDIGEGPPPPPALISTRPVVVRRDRDYDAGPLYLHVPPGFERNWSKHCSQYNACGRPVYFVKDDWYQREYVPRYQARHPEESRRVEESRQEERQQDRRSEQERRQEEKKQDRQEERRDDQNRDH
jgi:hypothetical protein